jgi:hypothetical protein
MYASRILADITRVTGTAAALMEHVLRSALELGEPLNQTLAYSRYSRATKPGLVPFLHGRQYNCALFYARYLPPFPP